MGVVATAVEEVDSEIALVVIYSMVVVLVDP